VNVGVHEPRRHRLPAQVHDLGVLPLVGLDLLVASDRDDLLVLAGHGLNH
jgi:hypothetical protein